MTEIRKHGYYWVRWTTQPNLLPFIAEWMAACCQGCRWYVGSRGDHDSECRPDEEMEVLSERLVFDEDKSRVNDKNNTGGGSRSTQEAFRERQMTVGKAAKKRALPVVQEPQHQASGSATDRLIQCTYWASAPIERVVELPWEMRDDGGPLAKFGTGFHTCMEKHLTGVKLTKHLVGIIAETSGVAKDHERLYDYYRRGSEFIDDLIKKRKWTILHVEQKYAYDPFADKSRFMKSKKARDYTERRARELPMTLDLVAAQKEQHIVFDWKTGHKVYEALTNGQIKSGALAVDRHEASPNASHHAVVGMLVRIDDEFVEVNESMLEVEDLVNHRNVLRNRIDAAMTNPFIRMGPECLYCKALEICPAHRDTLGLSDLINTMVEREDIGRFYEERLQPAKKLVEKLYDRVGQYIDMNGPVPMPSGKYLTHPEHEEENLSKASIKRILGNVEGEKLIEELRAKGVVDVIKKSQLRAVIDPSGRK